MTSITDVYEGDARRVASHRRRLLGTGIFAVGAGMVAAAIAIATTSLGVGTFGQYGARELAGVLAGLGLPGVVLGVFVVLPASRVTRSAAVIGASLAVFGVTLFQHAYPYAWIENDPLVALATIGVYFAGIATTFWCLFVALATFETRRDPGGTATMEITEEGRIRIVEEAHSLPGMGGIGLFGNDPDGAVATQTNRPADLSAEGVGSEPAEDGGVQLLGEAGRADGGAGSASTGATSTPSPGSPSTGPTADGGSGTVSTGGGTADAAPQRTDDAEFLTAADQRGRPDEYCGNCAHFEYVKADGDIEPYCGFTGTLMDDMDACEEWTQAD